MLTFYHAHALAEMAGDAAAFSGLAEMTDAEFDQAIEAIRQGHITPREGRVITAATLMMRELCSVPDDFGPTHTQIVEFIDSLDTPYREVLKRVADDVPEEKHTFH